MAFTSFTKFFMKKEIDEETPSSDSTFLPMSSKFKRSRSQSDVSSNHSEFSSTDAGDDICETFVDFDDFNSASSDEEATPESRTSKLRQQESSAACIYSIMMLLHMRSTVASDADPTVRYSTRAISELPSSPTRSKSQWKSSDNSQASAADAAESWRQRNDAFGESCGAQPRRCGLFGESASDEAVLRSVRSILNKLTIEKFDSLFEQLANCGLTHPHHVSMLMREVFEKATTQHHFIPMYADLCVKLEKDRRVAVAVEEADLPNNFRRLLLNECQGVFEQLLEADSTDAAADEEMQLRKKQRALGNMKLIGHLLVQGMLTSDVFIRCSQRLLQHRGDCPAALESLVALMMVVAPSLDKRESPHFGKLEDIFSDMRSLTKDKSVQPRDRFLIRDVLDARDAKWPSSNRHVARPTTLKEVRKSAENTHSQGTSDLSLDSPPRSQTKGGSEAVKKSVSFSFDTAPAAAEPPKQGFDVVAWRRSLASIFDGLASDKNIPAAVQRVREQHVPIDCQAEQFMDLLTRVVEERRGAVRRCHLAFLAGLGAAEHSAFARKECVAGIGRFFNEVYADLLNEVHRLPAIMKSEFMPTVLSVFPEDELYAVVPSSMRK